MLVVGDAWQQRGQGWPGGAGWTSVGDWHHSVWAGPEALLGITSARRRHRQRGAGQASFAHVAEIYVGWVRFYSWILF